MVVEVVLMSRMLVRLFVVVGFLIAAPTLASAQSLAGAVRDTSGAILPGVTVEASSPALITKVRTSVTDEPGSIASPICRPVLTRSPSLCLVSPQLYAKASS
jgi:hypothetical protein